MTQHKVTLNEILEICKKYKWTLRRGKIRTVRGTLCPLQVFTNNHNFYRNAARIQGASDRIVDQIIGASDKYSYPTVRAKMLKVLGLREKK